MRVYDGLSQTRYEFPVEETADLIDSWADTLERFAWIQGEMYAYDISHLDGEIVGVCVVGAMEVVREVIDARSSAYMQAHYRHARGVLVDHLGVGRDSDKGGDLLPDWNDDPDRTKQEVLDGLRGAAKAVRKMADADAGPDLR